uniref:Uncharacterized protein n=1 Tax=Anguilla anguilla TaxID=7936 RepID=A0A0E9P833_ANGAN
MRGEGEECTMVNKLLVNVKILFGG